MIVVLKLSEKLSKILLVLKSCSGENICFLMTSPLVVFTRDFDVVIYSALELN